jgi:Ca2+/Na+ antiporter
MKNKIAILVLLLSILVAYGSQQQQKTINSDNNEMVGFVRDPIKGETLLFNIPKGTKISNDLVLDMRDDSGKIVSRKKLSEVANIIDGDTKDVVYKDTSREKTFIRILIGLTILVIFITAIVIYRTRNEPD